MCITEKGDKMQYLEKLRVYLQNKILSSDIIDYIMEDFKEITYKAGDCILDRGGSTSYIYFTLEGMARSVYVHEDGTENTMSFYAENTWSCLYNYLKNKTTNVYIEAIEDTTMAYISVEDFRKMIINNELCYTFFMSLYTKIQRNIRCFIDDFDNFSIEQKYNIFIEQYSNIADRVDKNYIASYIGATQEELELLLKEK